MNPSHQNLISTEFRIYYSPTDDPLHHFYIPALKASIRYDRSAGFFSSSALAVAAEGVAHLIQNGGKMRLLVGAELSEDDVQAIRSGHDLRERITENLLQHFPDPQEALLKKRLEVMAWMIAEGALEIRVVLPRGSDGHPLPAIQSQDYYHPKSGIFTDAEGNQIAFTGSVNESETAWLRNYETFSVYFSWNETKPYLAQISINFEKLWAGKEPDWIAIDIPQAVKARLLKYRPASAPNRDPLEKEPPSDKVGEVVTPFNLPSTIEQRERLIFQFLRDAPHMLHAGGLGAATAPLHPWPHQTRVADAVIQGFPQRAMLCDEVGLGKTIETGLILRQLVLSGLVKRCLILAPKSVLRQWQEELYEKFCLRVPLYDGSRYWDVYGEPLQTPGGNPWEAFPILLAGSQLAKRADRRAQILNTHGWDLLVVDEAHHARRKDFKEHIYRPNRLLGLLNELSQQNKITGLLLMTATPMQIHPLEVWDLLKLLGLGGRWGADEASFLHYFSELQKDFGDVDWDFIFSMLGDELQTGGEWDPALVQEATRKLGPVKWANIMSLTTRPVDSLVVLKSLKEEDLSLVREIARRQTPMRRLMFRNTRALLRDYQKRGILSENVPTRKPEIVRVRMREDEYQLYERVDEYISYFYQKYENERRGMGFIMTVYRRRLTSSFYAVRCSLERRLNYLLGGLSFDKTFTDDDLEQEELSLDLSEEIEPTSLDLYKAEITYLQDFISELKILSVTDSKLEKLKTELREVFKVRPTVLVFTQYTDTMDYLRDQLVEVYGSEVACYSGRGGEVWNGITWVLTTKEHVKNEFKEGRIRILLCTESASEGLNLQTCGVLINYDMPWNPMRVEQRIGRIDRIGQNYKVVWISNYFYEDTIEDIIYKRLAERINWFEVVVGELQPILAEIGEVTRRLAMLPPQQRQEQIELEIEALNQRLQNRASESLNIDEFSQTDDYQPSPKSPVTLAELESNLTNSPSTAQLFKPHPSIPQAYLLNLNGESLPVTFSPECYDTLPQTLQFLSYGNPLLDDVLDQVSQPDLGNSNLLVRLETKENEQICSWYRMDEDHQVRPVLSLEELIRVLSQPISAETAEPELISQSEQLFKAHVAELFDRQRTIITRRKYADYLTEKARAQRLLVKAALVEIALGQQPELLETEVYPTAFDGAAVRGLARHGYPWGPLLKLAYQEDILPNQEDPYFQEIRNASRDSLKGKLILLTEEAKKGVKLLSTAKKAYEEF